MFADTLTITVNPALTALAGADRAFCFGDSALLGGTPAATGGTGPYAYLWTPALGLSSTTIPNPTVAAIDSTIDYLLLVSDAIGCTAADTVRVRENPALGVDAGAADSVCFGGSTALAAVPAGGTLPYVFAWTPAALLANAAASATNTLPLTATTVFTVALADSAGCAATDTVQVWVNPDLVADATAALSLVCFGDCVDLDATATGGSPGYTYAWTPAALLDSADVASPTACGLTATTTFVITITDSLGCTSSDSVTVLVNPQLAATAAISGTVCFGGTIQLSGVAAGGTPGYDYLWSPATGLSDTTLVIPLVQGLTATQAYVLTVTDANGCTAADSVTVFVTDQIVVDAGLADSVCFENPALLSGTASGGAQPFTSYAWAPAGLLLSPDSLQTATLPLTTTTTFYLTTTDAAGCSETDSVTVFCRSRDRGGRGKRLDFLLWEQYLAGWESYRQWGYRLTELPVAAYSCTFRSGSSQPRRIRTGQQHRLCSLCERCTRMPGLGPGSGTRKSGPICRGRTDGQYLLCYHNPVAGGSFGWHSPPFDPVVAASLGTEYHPTRYDYANADSLAGLHTGTDR
ncbi:MAG: hypothetical protein OHK0039_18140 [Bacteroidia bacterium]